MKLISTLLLFCFVTLSCSNVPLDELPYGASVHGIEFHENSKIVEYYSMLQSGSKPENLKGWAMVTQSLNETWQLTTPDDFSIVSSKEDVSLWLAAFASTMNLVAPGMREFKYHLTTVPSGMTYWVKTKHHYTESLMPLEFVVFTARKELDKEVFVEILRTFSHEQYHIYQRLDLDTKPEDNISTEAFSYFVQSCVMNKAFGEVSGIGEEHTSINEYVAENPSRTELQSAMQVNANTNDVVQHSLAGQVIIRLLFQQVMDQPNKKPADFSTELDLLCTKFGANTPTNWEQLLDLYE